LLGGLSVLVTVVIRLAESCRKSILITLLQSFQHKAVRVNLQEGTQTTASKDEHAVEVPFDADKFDEIFETAFLFEASKTAAC
jgi:hypothetical protein